MVQSPTIPHFEALVVVNKILEGQGRGTFNSLLRLLHMKSLISGSDMSLIVLCPCPSRILMFSIRAFKLGIVSICTTYI